MRVFNADLCVIGWLCLIEQNLQLGESVWFILECFILGHWPYLLGA